MGQKEEKQEVFPWKKELIVRLFKRQKILRIVLLIAIVPAIGLFAWLCFRGLNLHRQNERTFDWVETPCVIESVDWQWYAKESLGGLWDPADPDTHDDPGTKDSSHYEIRYHYLFDSVRHVSNRYSIARCYEMVIWRHSDEAMARESQFEPKQAGRCYVNPESPEEAVLVRAALMVSDYALHLVWPVAAFVVYLFIPAWVFKKYHGDQKQLSELVTGRKEDILEDMNRLLDVPDPPRGGW